MTVQTTEEMSEIIRYLENIANKSDVSPEWVQHAEEALYRAKEEIERFQSVLDGRPAINADLPESYINWSQSIYVMEERTSLRSPGQGGD